MKTAIRGEVSTKTEYAFKAKRSLLKQIKKIFLISEYRLKKEW